MFPKPAFPRVPCLPGLPRGPHLPQGEGLSDHCAEVIPAPRCWLAAGFPPSPFPCPPSPFESQPPDFWGSQYTGLLLPPVHDPPAHRHIYDSKALSVPKLPTPVSPLTLHGALSTCPEFTIVMAGAATPPSPPSNFQGVLIPSCQSCLLRPLASDHAVLAPGLPLWVLESPLPPSPQDLI